MGMGGFKNSFEEMQDVLEGLIAPWMGAIQGFVGVLWVVDFDRLALLPCRFPDSGVAQH